MKNKLYKIALAGALITSMMGCSKFEEINTRPTEANEEQVQVEYFLNNSIIGSQQDPHIAERIFVYYWKTAANQHYFNYLNIGISDDGFNGDYWRYLSEWLNNANSAIEIGQKKAENGSAFEYNNNLMQVSRIWKAYLLSELSDNFGPAPINAFQGVNPEFTSVKDVYYYLFTELTDAVSKIDGGINRPDRLQVLDPAYRYEWDKWIRFANSLRMRFAIRLSEVDPQKAQTEFEAAVATNRFIENESQMFKVAERPGWDALTGVMSRPWNTQTLSATLNNLMIGLGGVKSENQLANSEIVAKIKSDNDMGLRYWDQFSTMSNDPSQGFYLDGIPNKIDPRAFKAFFIPGDKSNSDYWADASIQDASIKISESRTDRLNTTFTWNAFSGGTWGAKGGNIVLRGQNGRVPGMVNKFRNSTNSRIFFAAWESYFLMAEGALRGWRTPISDEQAYNKAIEENFKYWGVTNHLTNYLASTEYSRVGTSVSYSHVTEPSASRTITYVDGITKTPGTMTIAYPANTIYKNGTVKNDKLTKIITQKYIASFPYLPLEAWSDHRRLGLPFFENPAIEVPLAGLPALNASNYKTNQVTFFPQRVRYPSSFRNADGDNYNSAVTLLGGEDRELTPLWWAKQN